RGGGVRRTDVRRHDSTGRARMFVAIAGRIGLLENSVKVVLLDIGQQVEEERVETGAIGSTGAQIDEGRQLSLEGVVVVVDAEEDLLQVVHAPAAGVGVADLCDGRDQQAGEQRADGEYGCYIGAG